MTYKPIMTSFVSKMGFAGHILNSSSIIFQSIKILRFQVLLNIFDCLFVMNLAMIILFKFLIAF